MAEEASLEEPKGKLFPLAYFVFGFMIIPIVHLTVPGMNLIGFPFNLAGLAGIFCGVYLIGRTYRLMKNHKTPHTYDRSVYVVREGPFRFSRNPMYLGMAILLAGEALLFGNPAALAVPILFCLVMQAIFIPYEENKMEAELGEAYIAYKDRVRRWF